MITLGNGTHVVEVLLLVQDSLQPMHSLCFYVMETSDFYDLLMTKDERQQMAEFEAAVRRACLSCFDVHADCVEISCEIILLIYTSKMNSEEFEF